MQIQMQIVQQAMELAVKYHSGVYRKNKVSNYELPYVAHPMEVMKMVYDAGAGTPINLAAAVLHDVIEDTFINPKIIADEVGEEVLAIVNELTFKETPGCSKEIKAQEKDQYLRSFKDKSVNALVIKIADRFANIMDFYNGGDEAYAIKYRDKAEPLFDVLENRMEEIEKVFGSHTVRILDDAMEALYSL